MPRLLDPRFACLVAVVGGASACFDFGFEPGGTEPTSASSGASSSASAASGGGASSSATGSGSTCGDGRIDAGEDCDDSNREDGDGCDAQCRAEPAAGGGGAGGSASTGTGSTGTGTGTGGAGGADPCEGIDFETSSEHCGECGFSCGGAACEGGRCGASVVLDDLGWIKSVLVAGDTLFIEQRNGPENTFPGTIRTLPLDFDADTDPGLDFPVQNAVGSLALGTEGQRHVYFTGQWDSVTPNPNIYACDELDCYVDAIPVITSQIQNVLPVGTTLYLLEATNNRLLSTSIDAVTGRPSTATTELVASYDPPGIVADGVLVLQHLVSPSRLYWSSYDSDVSDGSEEGCIFQVEVGSLPLAPLSCFTEMFTAQGFVAAPDGTIYAQERLPGEPYVDRILRYAPDGSLEGVFDDHATYPRGLDERHLYVADGETFAIRAIPLDGSGIDAGETQAHSDGPRPYALDASHPDYVFYSVGETLYRWPKPKT